MRIYISGPITGYADHNRPAFAAAAQQLRAAGHEVVDPHEVCPLLAAHECLGPCVSSDALAPWADYLRADLIAMLSGADALAMLPGWSASRGANLERDVALALGWEVKHLHDWLYPHDHTDTP